jgi:hypothetical protein
MSGKAEEFISQDEAIDKGEQIQRLLYRIIPYWPLIVFAIIIVG